MRNHISDLPKIMVAPNGARKSKQDHPAIPISISETVATAKACFEAGADGLHAHVRDSAALHTLDVGLYRELLRELERDVPEMAVQVTTEAVGMYSAVEQRGMVRELQPAAVSASIRELTSDNDDAAARDFYEWAFEAGISVQHILYDATDVELLSKKIEAGIVKRDHLQMIVVLGRYSAAMESSVEDLQPFLLARKEFGFDTFDNEWAICAFGKKETDCLLAAAQHGGKIRVGFENSFHNRDGSLAKDNAERVGEIRKLLTLQSGA